LWPCSRPQKFCITSAKRLVLVRIMLRVPRVIDPGTMVPALAALLRSQTFFFRIFIFWMPGIVSLHISIRRFRLQLIWNLMPRMVGIVANDGESGVSRSRSSRCNPTANMIQGVSSGDSSIIQKGLSVLVEDRRVLVV